MRAWPGLIRAVAAMSWIVITPVPEPATAGEGERPVLDSGDADPRGFWESAKRGFRLREGPDATPAWAEPQPRPSAATARSGGPTPTVDRPVDYSDQTDPTVGRALARGTPGTCQRADLDAEELRELQAVLSEIRRADGQSTLQIDGVCGPRTLAAIRAFEARERMAVEGVPTRAVLEHAREVGATLANRNMPPPTSVAAGDQTEASGSNAIDPSEANRPAAAPSEAVSMPAPGGPAPSSTDPALAEVAAPPASSTPGDPAPVRPATPAPPAGTEGVNSVLSGDPELWRVAPASPGAAESGAAPDDKLAGSPQSPLY